MQCAEDSIRNRLLLDLNFLCGTTHFLLVISLVQFDILGVFSTSSCVPSTCCCRRRCSSQLIRRLLRLDDSSTDEA